jgi:hypothetical protein
MMPAMQRRSQLGSFMNLPKSMGYICNIYLTIRAICYTTFLENNSSSWTLRPCRLRTAMVEWFCKDLRHYDTTTLNTRRIEAEGSGSDKVFFRLCRYQLRQARIPEWNIYSGGIFTAAITVGNNARENQADIQGLGVERTRTIRTNPGIHHLKEPPG